MKRISTINYVENKYKNIKLKSLIDDKELLYKLSTLDINSTEDLLSYSLKEYKELFNEDDYVKLSLLNRKLIFIDDLTDKQKQDILSKDNNKLLNSSLDLLNLTNSVKYKIKYNKAYTIRDLKMLVMFGYLNEVEVKKLNEDGLDFYNMKISNPYDFIKSVTPNKDMHLIKLEDLKFKYTDLLHKININTIGQLNNLDLDKLYYVRGIGKQTLIEINKLLKDLHLNKSSKFNNDNKLYFLNLSKDVTNILNLNKIYNINDLKQLFDNPNLLIKFENYQIREIEMKLRKNNINYSNIPVALTNNYNSNTYEDVVTNKIKIDLNDTKNYKEKIQRMIDDLEKEKIDLSTYEDELQSSLIIHHNRRLKNKIYKK